MTVNKPENPDDGPIDPDATASAVDPDVDDTPADELIDEWGRDSFPASDPPGYPPPSLKKRLRD